MYLKARKCSKIDGDMSGKKKKAARMGSHWANQIFQASKRMMMIKDTLNLKSSWRIVGSNQSPKSVWAPYRQMPVKRRSE